MPDPTETHGVLFETFGQSAGAAAKRRVPSAETQPAENQAAKRADHTAPLDVYQESQPD